MNKLYALEKVFDYMKKQKDDEYQFTNITKELDEFKSHTSKFNRLDEIIEPNDPKNEDTEIDD